MPKNILFRADSSSTIGTGHIMRDLVLAQRYKNSKIIFVTQDLKGNINHKIDYEIVTLKSNDLDELVVVVKEYDIDMVVIDHYGIDWVFEKALKERTDVKILSFDDTYEKHHCDILLNHNIYADESRYKDLVPKGCELRCGAKYTLIRDEFIKQKRVKRVFIAMGGADSANLNIKILEVVQEFEGIEAVVVTTSANKNLDAVRQYIANKKNIELYVDSKEIAKLMRRSDFAIVTPSVVLNEIFYMGLDFVAIKVADNQDDMVQYLLNNRYKVLEYFDANRLRKIIQKLEIELINFVGLSLEEKKTVLEWRNNNNVRKWMLTQDKISFDNHLSFINTLFQAGDKKYFFVKQNDTAIGVIDFTNINKSSAEFGLYAKPNKKGVGHILMNSIISYAFENLKVERLVANVFKNNTIAIKLYQKYGFKIVDSKEMICMELKIKV